MQGEALPRGKWTTETRGKPCEWGTRFFSCRRHLQLQKPLSNLSSLDFPGACSIQYTQPRWEGAPALLCQLASAACSSWWFSLYSATRGYPASCFPHCPGTAIVNSPALLSTSRNREGRKHPVIKGSWRDTPFTAEGLMESLSHWLPALPKPGSVSCFTSLTWNVLTGLSASVNAAQPSGSQ